MIQIDWKNNTFVLDILIILFNKGFVERQRKKSKITLTSVRTARVEYGPNEYIKVMSIPLFYNLYNFNINAMDRADQLAANNPGLRLCRRGGWQVIEHWLLCVILYNYFILALWRNPENARPINFRF
jgi:hypothetical protein